MDTDNLKLFVLAAEKGNISAAGKALGMAPAVASARLAKLENHLGADLLHRSTRKVSLSLDGAEFLPFAKEMLAQENAAYAALGRHSNDVSGTLRFTAPSTFAQLYIAPLLSEFLTTYSGIKLDLRLSDTMYDLIDGSFDLALRNTILEDSSMTCRKLANDYRILCASPSYVRQHTKPKHLNDLKQHKLIGFKDQTATEIVNGKGVSGTFDPGQPSTQLIIDDGLSLKMATVAGAGISINSWWSVHQEIANGQLIQLLPDYQINDDSALWLVYPKANVLTAKVRVFIDYLVESIGTHPVFSTTK